MVHKDLRFAPRPDGLVSLTRSTIPTRGSKEEWGNKKPPALRSSDWHEKMCMMHGGSGHDQIHEEVHADTLVKVAFDIDIVTDRRLENNGADLVSIMMNDQVLKALANKTGLALSVADLTVATDHRRLADGKYKSSYHVLIPSFCITACHLNAFYDMLNLPATVDRAPFNISPTGRQLWRVIGASKNGSLTFFKPAFLCEYAYKHPFHQYLPTHLTGNEMNITELFPRPESRPSRRPRTDVTEVAYPIRMQRRVGLGCTDAYNIRVRVYTGVHTCPR